MKLSTLKQHLSPLSDITFVLPNGEQVPSHFHVTEVGQLSKKFIDCGGTIREESKVSFQLWYSDDYDHRLSKEKLEKIIAIAESTLGLSDGEIVVEYQGDTIGKYGLDVIDGKLHLLATQTDCLAKEGCAVPVAKKKISLNELIADSQTCTPGGSCC